MLSDNARRMGPLRDKLQWVELWLKRRHMSSKLSRRVRAYYTEIWANHKGKAAFVSVSGSLLWRGLSPTTGSSLCMWANQRTSRPTCTAVLLLAWLQQHSTLSKVKLRPVCLQQKLPEFDHRRKHLSCTKNFRLFPVVAACPVWSVQYSVA